MALVKINGRTQFFYCNEVEITKTGKGRFTVKTDRREFEIIGGTESGGTSKEWFCNCPILYGDRWLPVKSMVAAIKAGLL